MKNSVSTLRIALIGDQSPTVKAHAAIPIALKLCRETAGAAIEETWIRTADVSHDLASQLQGFNAVWCVPGSPYQSMDGALRAIRFARERKIPFLGTCGGSQHAMIEYCRNVLGYAEADHAESNPGAKFPLIVPLPCALRETESRIRLSATSRAWMIYGRDEITEPFNCGFGLNPEYHRLLLNSALKITGVGDDGVARVVELDDHPFFIATLYQPERTALNNVSHPLINAFVQAAAAP